MRFSLGVAAFIPPVLCSWVFAHGCAAPETRADPDRTLEPSTAPRSASGDFTLPDLHGDRVRLSDYRGKVVMVSFWATWCEPCQVELTQVQKLWDRYRERGFELVAINVDPPDAQSAVRDMVRRYRYSFPILLDSSSEVVNRFNPKMELPFSILFDARGQVSATHQGFVPGDEAVIEDEIRKLVGG
jgi:thiol-disulfide isomerase/thioredoxin